MTDMDDTIRVPLTEAEKAEMGERLASMLAERDALEAQRKEAMDEHSKNRRALDDQIDELAEELRSGRKEARQGDLFHEEKPAPAQATQLLAEVAERAADAVAQAFKPSDPHPFQGNGKRDECALCGGTAIDPIHEGKANELVESLQRVNDGENVDRVIGDIKARRAKRKGGRKRGGEARA